MTKVFVAIGLYVSGITLAGESLSTEPHPMSTQASSMERLEERTMFAVGGSYAQPADPRITVDEDPAWKFQLSPGGSPQTGNYNDSAWSSVSLPHTWNEVDGLSNNPASGDGWYRKVINTTAAMAGKKIYLNFEGGNQVTSLYIDGTQIDLNPASAAIDSHLGGYQGFTFDVTTALNAAVPSGQSGHVLAVKVNNQANANIAPSGGGGYTYFGGLYRDVTLLAVSPTHVALTKTVTHAGLSGADTASSIAFGGVTFSNSAVVVGATSAQIQVTTTLDNQQAARGVSVTSYLVDAAGVVRAQAFTNQALTASQSGATVTQTATVSNPHLWDGRIDPYLYTLYVEVHDQATYKLLDIKTQKVGIRTFRFNASPNPTGSDPTNVAAFMLNGHAYRLVGADMHQDSGRLDAGGQPVGYAQTDTQIRADVDLLADMGGTAIRTSHYQDNQALYDYCDQIGVMVFTEAPVKSAQANDAFRINAEDQFNELILQNYDHPSVFAWGFGNEVADDSSKTLFNLFKQFNVIAHTLDPNRATALADYGGAGPSYNTDGTPKNYDAIPDILDTHLYTYWYAGGTGTGITQNVKQPQGTAEYGGGGSAYQYADSFTLPVSAQTGGVTTRFHPQNQLEQIHQRQYTDLTGLNFLWGQIVWQMFDNASPGQSQGDANGLNDKGLVTRDRVPKDVYYFYKAALNDPTRSWNNQRVLTFGDRFWTARNKSAATVTVYSNIGAPTLTLNGVSLGAMSPLSVGTSGVIPDTYTMNVTLAVGVNTLRVNKTYADGQAYTESAVWTYRSGLSGTSLAKIDFLPSGQTAATGYLADNGGAYGARNGQTYGWQPASGSATAIGSTLAVGSTFGTGSATDPTANGVNLNYDSTYKTSSVWEYELPNGTYDVQINAGQSGTSDGVTNLSLEGKTAAIDSNGNTTQDVFYSRVTVKDGKLTLAVAPGGVNARVDSIQINSVTDPTGPTVTGVSVNNGQAQRSAINALAVTFDQPVTSQAGAFGLSMRGGMTYALSASVDSTGTTCTLSPADGSSLAVLPSGVYDLSIDPTKVVDGDGHPMAGAYTATLHRLFGDVNGDRTVNATDALYFGLAKNSSSASLSYKSYFDFDGDGDIDAVDALRFTQNKGKSLTY